MTSKLLSTFLVLLVGATIFAYQKTVPVNLAATEQAQDQNRPAACGPIPAFKLNIKAMDTGEKVIVPEQGKNEKQEEAKLPEGNLASKPNQNTSLSSLVESQPTSVKTVTLEQVLAQVQQLAADLKQDFENKKSCATCGNSAPSDSVCLTALLALGGAGCSCGPPCCTPKGCPCASPCCCVCCPVCCR